ncbi:hypothetical protein [Reticulibacter mediterranei]|uniref:hypothetical protein n=1 Tax=Reticulibacter mediterranei TaxID=2778369 RepID=UPI001C68ABC4|nr:hypothetical protein [Reticulibacter mediterranei]
MKPVVMFPWKMSVFASLGLLCSVVAFVLLMPTISTSASMSTTINGAAGCRHFEQDFQIAGPSGGLTPTLIKSSGCNGGVWVRFTKKPYDMNAMVCLMNMGAVTKCESQQNWFSPTPFTDNTQKEVDTIPANTEFAVMFTADGASEPKGTGHIVIDY